MPSTYLVCEQGYEHNAVLAGFTERARADHYADEVRPLSSYQVVVEEIVLDAPRRALPGTWTAEIWFDGTLGDVEPSLYGSLVGERRITISRATVEGESVPVSVRGRGLTRYEALTVARQFLARARRAGILTPARVAASTAYAVARGGYIFVDYERQMLREHRLERWEEARAAGGYHALRRRKRAELAATWLESPDDDASSAPATP